MILYIYYIFGGIHMSSKRSIIKNRLHIALETPISVSWTSRRALIEGENFRVYNVNIFFEETFIIADAVITKNQINESSIILFKKDVAEEFVFDESGQYIRHIISGKDSNGILYKGSFGAFTPVAEILQKH